MDWMTEPYRRYFSLAGRSCRQEFWAFALFVAVVAALFAVSLSFSSVNVPSARADLAAFEPPLSFWLLVTGGGLWLLFTVPPLLAVLVRRLHDLGQPGWWALAPLIALWSPWVGGLAGVLLLAAMCLDGQRGRNRFGTDPKSRLGYRLSA